MGGTFTNPFAANAGPISGSNMELSPGPLIIDSPVGTTENNDVGKIRWQEDGSERWIMGKTWDAANDFVLYRINTGGGQGEVLRILRSNGNVTFPLGSATTMAGQVLVGTNSSAAGHQARLITSTNAAYYDSINSTFTASSASICSLRSRINFFPPGAAANMTGEMIFTADSSVTDGSLFFIFNPGATTGSVRFGLNSTSQTGNLQFVVAQKQILQLENVTVGGSVTGANFLSCTPVAGTFTPTHYVSMKFNGVTYRIPIAV